MLRAWTRMPIPQVVGCVMFCLPVCLGIGALFFKYYEKKKFRQHQKRVTWWDMFLMGVGERAGAPD